MNKLSYLKTFAYSEPLNLKKKIKRKNKNVLSCRERSILYYKTRLYFRLDKIKTTGTLNKETKNIKLTFSGVES